MLVGADTDGQRIYDSAARGAVARGRHASYAMATIDDASTDPHLYEEAKRASHGDTLGGRHAASAERAELRREQNVIDEEGGDVFGDEQALSRPSVGRTYDQATNRRGTGASTSTSIGGGYTVIDGESEASGSRAHSFSTDPASRIYDRAATGRNSTASSQAAAPAGDSAARSTRSARQPEALL